MRRKLDIVTILLQSLGGVFLVVGVVSFWSPVLLGNLGDLAHRRANYLVFMREARKDFVRRLTAGNVPASRAQEERYDT